MKKIVSIFILLFVSILPHPGYCEDAPRRSLYVSLIQDPPVLSNRIDIAKLILFAKKAHINTLFVQVYRANRAWFDSPLTDLSDYYAAYKSVGGDPFELLIREAHRAGIEVHAWLNLLSLGKNIDSPLLQKYGPQILTRNLKSKKTIEEFKIDDQYFLEPGDMRVRSALSAIVEDLLISYPGLDGIQFDYIRYPDKEPYYGFTKANVDRYKLAVGTDRMPDENDSWKDWKRAQVTELLEELIKKTRSIRPNIRISTTGCAPLARAYHEAFQEWPSWLNRGLVDFVTFMDYSTDPKEFERFIVGAKREVVDFSKVMITLGAYKMVDDPEIFFREYRIAGSYGACGYAVLHYGSILDSPELYDFMTREKI